MYHNSTTNKNVEVGITPGNHLAQLYLDLSYLALIIDMQSVLFVVVAIDVLWLQEV